MAVYVSNIVIEQGFDFSSIFELADSLTDGPLNLVGYGVTAQIRKIIQVHLQFHLHLQ